MQQPSIYYGGWNATGLAFLLSLVGSGTIFYSYGIYATSFAAEFHASHALINSAYMAVLLVSGAASVAVGRMIARWGLTTVGILGAVGTATGFFLVSFAQSMWQVVALFGVLIAAADALISVVFCNTLIIRWFERRRGLALAITTMGLSGAAIVYPPVTSALTVAIGWRQTFLVHGATMLLLIPALLLWARVPSHIADVEWLPRIPGLIRADDTPAVSAGDLLRRADFWGVTIAIGVLGGLNGAVMISIVPFAIAQGTDPTRAALLVSTIGASALGGKMVVAVLADRFNLLLILRLAMFNGAVAMLMLYLAKGFALWAVISAIFGLSLGGMMPVWGALFAQLYSASDYPAAIGWSRTIMTPLLAGVPLLAGLIYDATGGYQLSWLAFFILALVGFLFTFLRSKHGRLSPA